MSEQDEQQHQDQDETPQDETPAVTVQAGLATASGSVSGPEDED